MEVGLSPGDFVLDRDPAPSPIFGKFLLCPKGWMHHDATWYGCIPQPRGLCVRWGPSPLPKKGRSPLANFRPISIVAKRLDQDGTWHLGGPWSRPHCARWGTSFPPLKRGQSPLPIFGQFLLSPNGWMNQDGTLHGGGPWSKPHCARWGPSSPPQKGDRAPPIFGPCLLSRNGWMHQDATWYGGRPQPRRLCVRW